MSELTKESVEEIVFKAIHSVSNKNKKDLDVNKPLLNTFDQYEISEIFFIIDENLIKINYFDTDTFLDSSRNHRSSIASVVNGVLAFHNSVQ